MADLTTSARPLLRAERAPSLFERITDFANLYAAYKAAATGKHDRAAILRHDLHAEKILWRLHWELLNGKYQHGRYHTFMVRDPKPRDVAAAPFTDRIVHHALVRQIEPLFDPGFIYDSYACRQGKGTHRAALRLQQFLRSSLSSGQPIFVLRADIRKFFASVDHAVLADKLSRRIHDTRSLELIRIILASYSEATLSRQIVGGGGTVNKFSITAARHTNW